MSVRVPLSMYSMPHVACMMRTKISRMLAMTTFSVCCNCAKRLVL
ncbi:Uncharacterised protein [Vibrio cholerae]|nr:Uncharacterised protein [Vibrio cholerae]